MKHGSIAAIGLCCLLTTASPAATGPGIDFETIQPLTLGVEDYGLAGDHGRSFTAGSASLAGYHYTDPWDYWGGFCASNRTVIGVEDTYHQYTSAPGTDHTLGAGGTYAIGYNDFESPIGCAVSFAESQDVAGAWFTNNAWAAEYMADNYGPGDYYHLVVTAYDAGTNAIGSKTVDLTGVTDWRWFGLGFQDVSALGITMSSSDDWTPYYFCMDDVNIPEPATLCLLALGGVAALRRSDRRDGR